MDRELSKLELKSAHYMKSLIGEVLSLLSLHFKGATTINHLRIGHYIGQISLYENRPTNNAEIATALGIPRATVSRIVSDCVEKQWVVERADPDDGRKKLLYIEPDHPLADNFEKDFRQLVNELIENFSSGKIVLIDPVRDGFRDN